MASIGAITLYREKSIIHRFDDPSDGHEAMDGGFVLKSNRLTMETITRKGSETVVVRGQNIAGTLRMAAMVAERFLRDPNVFDPENPFIPNWGDLWTRKTSNYERQFNRDNWASLHVGGETVFTTRDSNPVTTIERLAAGADLDEKTLRAATCGLFGNISPNDVAVQHDSQTAVVITPFSDYLRAAVLERKGGRTGSFSVSVRHSSERKLRPSTVMNFCADLIESFNLRQFLERAPGENEQSAVRPTGSMLSQIEAAKARRRELGQYIDGFERANRVQYRPERPEL